MNNLSRRTLLKCLAALPAAGALDAFTPSLSWASSPRQAAAQSSTRLNVLFHGLIGFFVENGEICVMLAPAPNHVFQAGNQDSLMDLTKNRQYKLLGITGRPNLPVFDEERTPVVRGKFKKDSQKAYSTLVLPCPDDIFPQRRLRKTHGEFFSGNDMPQNLKELPLILVYVYKNVDLSKLRLDPLGWVPKAHDGVVNLHVYAEPLCDAPTGHVSKALPHLLSPLGNPQIQFNPEYEGNRAPLEDPKPPIPGVSSLDLRNLDEFRCHPAHPDNCIHLTVIPQ